MKKLYTILLGFSDHATGIDQYEAESAEDAVRKFIKSAESLENYDRNLLDSNLRPLIHVAKKKGFWSFFFDPNLMDIKWPDDNPVLGGYVVQTDPNGPVRDSSKNKS